ncbi:MAG: hypothetical protein SCALA702_12500 [Melioribacteraceae bacterium]|nr:MAG: hypothetical protein SCALA702_12500 [Melioribacteraceae bacterium]
MARRGGGKLAGFLFMLLVGILIGYLTMTFINIESGPGKKKFDMASLYGTMIDEYDSSNFALLDEYKFSFDDFKGTIITKGSNNILAAEINIESAGEISSSLEFDPSVFSFVGAAHLNENFESEMNFKDNIAEISNVGENSYLVIVRGKDIDFQPVKFKIFKDGNLLVDDEVKTVKQ